MPPDVGGPNTNDLTEHSRVVIRGVPERFRTSAQIARRTKGKAGRLDYENGPFLMRLRIVPRVASPLILVLIIISERPKKLDFRKFAVKLRIKRPHLFVATWKRDGSIRHSQSDLHYRVDLRLANDICCTKQAFHEYDFVIYCSSAADSAHSADLRMPPPSSNRTLS